MTQYTLVRHSGYTAAGNPQFEQAVELCEIDKPQAYRVRAAGGVVFDTYEAAKAAEATANFPSSVEGIHPKIKGYFSNLRIQGAELYVKGET
jgi:hypothetical protein